MPLTEEEELKQKLAQNIEYQRLDDLEKAFREIIFSLSEKKEIPLTRNNANNLVYILNLKNFEFAIEVGVQMTHCAVYSINNKIIEFFKHPEDVKLWFKSISLRFPTNLYILDVLYSLFKLPQCEKEHGYEWGRSAIQTTNIIFRDYLLDITAIIIRLDNSIDSIVPAWQYTDEIIHQIDDLDDEREYYESSPWTTIPSYDYTNGIRYNSNAINLGE